LSTAEIEADRDQFLWRDVRDARGAGHESGSLSQISHGP